MLPWADQRITLRSGAARGAVRMPASRTLLVGGAA